MAKPAPSFEKRRRERAKKEKREEKAKRKAERKAAALNGPAEDGEPFDGEGDEETPGDQVTDGTEDTKEPREAESP